LKILVIIYGSHRGGEETWSTLYNQVLRPLNADLAIVNDYFTDKSNSLYKKAKFIWEMKCSFNDYYKKNFYKKYYKFFFKLVKNTPIGGLNINEESKASGAIIFAFRHFVKNYYKEILLQYDKIIFTRSDFYYIDKFSNLSEDKFFITEGEDYGGIQDRTHIFCKSDIDNALGILEYINSFKFILIFIKYYLQYKIKKKLIFMGINENNFGFLYKIFSYPLELNSEFILLCFFKKNGIFKKIQRIKAIQFTCAIKGDKTRWKNYTELMPGSDIIFLKYESEYYRAINNLNNKK